MTVHYVSGKEHRNHYLLKKNEKWFVAQQTVLLYHFTQTLCEMKERELEFEQTLAQGPEPVVSGLPTVCGIL